MGTAERILTFRTMLKAISRREHNTYLTKDATVFHIDSSVGHISSWIVDVASRLGNLRLVNDASRMRVVMHVVQAFPREVLPVDIT